MDIRVKQILLITSLIISPIILFGTDYYVATTGLNVRSGAGKKYTIVFTLQKGDEIEVLSKHGDWYKIKYSGIFGYAHSKHLKPSSITNRTKEMYFIILFVIVASIAVWRLHRWRSEIDRKQFEIKRNQRRDYYNNEYLQSEEWQRKRYVVLKRDNWRCVYCGAPATQVHHKRYAKNNIGTEPIDWLVSICKPCHEAQHN